MSASLQHHRHQLPSYASEHHTSAVNISSSKPGPSRSSRSPKPTKSTATTNPTPDTTFSKTSQPGSTHTGAELFDAIVQAADPRHPAHAAWQDQYGSSSSRSSRASGSSSQIRDNVAPYSPATPPSLKSFDHSDSSTRKRPSARMARDGYSAYRQAHHAAGSDADDPLPENGRFTPVRSSFEGSIRSYSSSTVTSTGQRRRNRRLLESPKPLVPPVPPPRISSSTNWQSIYGSASMVDLSGSLSRSSAYPASPASTSDHLDRRFFAQHHPQRMVASPFAPFLRMAHPYASAVTLPARHEQEAARLPSPSIAQLPLEPPAIKAGPVAHAARDSAHNPPSRRSITSLRQQREAETAASQRPSLSERTPRNVHQDLQSVAPPSPQLPVPALPPKNIARTSHQATAFVARVPIPVMASPDMRAATKQLGTRDVDPDAFPIRRDDEFCANDFEMSDESESERDNVPQQLPMSSYHPTSCVPAPVAGTGAGKIRRSLDAVISPFRAGLLNSAATRNHSTQSSITSARTVYPKDESTLEGRRSFSESRFVRPFLPRQRAATLGRQKRPLSNVVDHSEEDIPDLSRSDEVRLNVHSQHQSSSADRLRPGDAAVDLSQPHESMLTMTSAQSVASCLTHATGNTNTAAASQRSRNRFEGFMSKLKGLRTPKEASSTSMRPVASPVALASPQNVYKDYRGASQAPAISASPSAVTVSLPAITSPRPERGLRSRVKSFTSLTSSRSKSEATDVPTVPAIPAMFATTESEATHSVWEESPRLPTSSIFPSQTSSRSLGKLFRRKESLDGSGDISAGLPLSPSRTSLSKETLEAVPRSSMSSIRGFDVDEPGGMTAGVAKSRTTIRKTLSPALLREAPQPSIDGSVREAHLVSQDHSPQLHNEELAGDKSGHDEAVQLDVGTVDRQRFQSPRTRRPTRIIHRVDRLSRVEELSERLSFIADPKVSVDAADSAITIRNSPYSQYSRSSVEHRSQNAIPSGTVREQALSHKLELAVMEEEGHVQEVLSDVQPLSEMQEGSNLLGVDGLGAVRPTAPLGVDPPSASSLALAPKSPATSDIGNQTTPPWRQSSFSVPSSGRTSFSKDRDRAPVASPLSPPLPAKRGVGQAIKKFSSKGKNKKTGKGIGPSDIIVVNLDDSEVGNIASPEMSARPSISAESRSSFAVRARPSFSSSARPSFGRARRSYDESSANSLIAAEMATKQLEIEANALMQSPFIHSSAVEDLSGQSVNSSGRKNVALDRPLRQAGGETAGLGLDHEQCPEIMPSRKSESMDISGSTSEGTFTTLGIQTPDNISLSHSYMSQLPTRPDLTGATTPVAGRASLDTMTTSLKSPDLLAFEGMLGRFPQQQKSLLQDISARVAKTPVLGSTGWSSREDLDS